MFLKTDSRMARDVTALKIDEKTPGLGGENLGMGSTTSERGKRMRDVTRGLVVIVRSGCSK